MSDKTTVRLALITKDYEQLKVLRQDLLEYLEPDSERVKSEDGVDLIELEYFEVTEAKLGCEVNLLKTLNGMKVPYSIEWDATNYISAGEAHYRKSNREVSPEFVELKQDQYIETDYIKISSVIKTFSDAKMKGKEHLQETLDLMIRDYLPHSWSTQVKHERNYGFVVMGHQAP
ncbi:hypothetical protein [Vibrio vulnificus]|uniref:Uncharacterized protein n=1 Tax=Vibrio vulnificus TaxID=672 RepID=A0A2S3R2G7_VIBVL|nr:hypothetical protein [Vibrio vulnificus]POB47290.1 hypothetical protein CRN52_14510 [Vibrio vulnificus]